MAEHGAALVGRDQSDREVPRVGVRSQVTALSHGRKAGVEHAEPFVITVGQFCPGVVVGVDELADQ